MDHPLYPSGTPRFNHVAMSLAPDLLDETNRADLCRFFGDVFGFEEYPTMTIDRKRLVLGYLRTDQFVFLVADDEPMRCPRLDHFGLAVGTLAELEGVQKRCEEFRQQDPRVDLIDHHVDDQEVVRIHSLYVRYLVPMMCEVQWWEIPEGSPIA